MLYTNFFNGASVEGKSIYCTNQIQETSEIQKRKTDFSNARMSNGTESVFTGFFPNAVYRV